MRAHAAGSAAAPSGWTSVDEMSDSSFPASDPPAVWTWDVARPPADKPREARAAPLVSERHSKPDDR